jgi:hypothetical protein
MKYFDNISLEIVIPTLFVLKSLIPRLIYLESMERPIEELQSMDMTQVFILLLCKTQQRDMHAEKNESCNCLDC